ncbi:CipC1 protein [Penicillium herquei]|nr:CipC1 protein [Penicillium herquei]
MGWFSDDSQQRSHHEQWNSSDPKQHEASFAHELIAGAASYEAAKAYEEHEKREGKPESHEKAKEIMAGFAGAFVDREVETRGLDFIDKEKAKREARKHIDGVPARDAGW